MNSKTTLIEMSAELSIYYKETLHLSKLQLLVVSYQAKLDTLSDTQLETLIGLAKSYNLSELESYLVNELNSR